jgi:hypothetical protein
MKHLKKPSGASLKRANGLEFYLMLKNIATIKNQVKRKKGD